MEPARGRGRGPLGPLVRDGETVLAAVRRGRNVPEAECPEPRHRPDSPRGESPVVELLKVLLKMKCETFGVAQKLVASAADVERIAASGRQAQVPALHGWRLQVFGEDALKLCRGETMLAVKKGKLALVESRPKEG